MGRALLVLNSDDDRRKASHWVSKAPWGTRIEFKASKRSLPQNDRLWAMLTDVAEHMRPLGKDFTTEEWKLLFMHAWGKEIRFLPGLDQKTVVPIGQSSSDLSKQEMTDLIEFIFAWGAENGVTFPEPPEAALQSAEGEGSDSATSPSAVAAEEPADAADQEAGEPEVAADQSTAPASVSLSDSDKAFLVRVFKTMKAAVGPDTNVFKRQAMVFTDEIGGMSDLVRAKAKTIRESLQTCCGDAPTKGTVEVGKYLAAIIGVDAKEMD
jgi:hypothetical protein